MGLLCCFQSKLATILPQRHLVAATKKSTTSMFTFCFSDINLTDAYSDVNSHFFSFILLFLSVLMSIGSCLSYTVKLRPLMEATETSFDKINKTITCLIFDN